MGYYTFRSRLLLWQRYAGSVGRLFLVTKTKSLYSFCESAAWCNKIFCLIIRCCFRANIALDVNGMVRLLLCVLVSLHKPSCCILPMCSIERMPNTVSILAQNFEIINLFAESYPIVQPYHCFSNSTGQTVLATIVRLATISVSSATCPA